MADLIGAMTGPLDWRPDMQVTVVNGQAQQLAITDDDDAGDDDG